MAKVSCEVLIRSHVMDSPKDSVFALSDFTQYGSYDSIRKALSDLVQDNFLVRITAGIYCMSEKPYKESIADPNALHVANALARNNQWSVCPGTEYARFHFCLTDDEPTIYTALSSGPSGTYKFGNNKVLKMIHCSSSFINELPLDAAMVVSAFMDLKNNKVTASDVFHFSQILSWDTKQKLLQNLSVIPARLRPVIEIICDEYGRVRR